MVWGPGFHRSYLEWRFLCGSVPLPLLDFTCPLVPSVPGCAVCERPHSAKTTGIFSQTTRGWCPELLSGNDGPLPWQKYSGERGRIVIRKHLHAFCDVTWAVFMGKGFLICLLAGDAWVRNFSFSLNIFDIKGKFNIQFWALNLFVSAPLLCILFYAMYVKYTQDLFNVVI